MYHAEGPSHKALSPLDTIAVAVSSQLEECLNSLNKFTNGVPNSMIFIKQY
jgi:hypothetical protein